MASTERVARPAPVVIVDLSSILFPIYMTSSENPDPNHTSAATVARVHALALGDADQRVAVCCDGGKNFRHDLDPSYKANRRDKDEALIHQLRLTQEQLRADGFAVWAVPGFEADDLIGSCVAQLPAGTPITIVTGDKDLLSLVSETVVAKSVRDGSIVDAEGVFFKFGVVPAQMTDYLCLVGDSSDNVAGAKGIGPKRAAELLARYQSIDALYQALGDGVALAGVSPSIIASLREFQPRLPLTRRLIQLRADAPIPLADLDTPRVAPPMEEPEPMPEPEPTPAVIDVTLTPTTQADAPLPTLPTNGNPSQALVPVLHGMPVEWERQLEPRSMSDVITLAKYVHDSRLFSGAYGSPQAVLSTVLAGRELGMQAMVSLRAIHIVEGKPTLSADLIRAMVIRSGLARYFRCTERTATRATFETQRGDDPPIALTFTIEEARTAWAGTDEKWNKSGWGHNPADMLVARAGAKLARLVFPDAILGLYATEEIEAAS